jgi:N-acetylmuramoyl-L-alanine amidase
VQIYRRGDRGPAVAEIRTKLAALDLLSGAGGDLFDAECDRAVRWFQQRRGLRVDGRVGPETYRALDEARWRLGDRLLSFAVAHPFVGDDVAELQRRLLELGFDPGRTDGVFGPLTEAAVRDFQRNVGIPADGTCGPRTLEALRALARAVTGGQPGHLREEERLLAAGSALSGKIVVIDPGHGGNETGAVGHGLVEADVVYDLARRLEGRLGAAGVLVYLTRGPEGSPSQVERARFANDAGADLVLSLHVDASPSPGCSGAATYFYGGAHGDSAIGARLADLVQAELVRRTDLVDCRTHPKTWELLRYTRMPTIRVEVGYLTNPGDAARLAEPSFRDTVAESVLDGIRHLYLPRALSELRDGEIPAPVPG